MIILVGKTCSGKDSVKKELLKFGYEAIVAYTTRPMRKDETDGVDYNFIEQSKFGRLVVQSFFAETTSYRVASGDVWHYGTALKDLKEDSIIILNPEGLREIKKIKSLNPVVFYLMADEETLWNRLRQRGDSADEARRRLGTDDIDFSGVCEDVDFAIKNNDTFTPKEIATIIHKLYQTIQDRFPLEEANNDFK